MESHVLNPTSDGEFAQLTQSSVSRPDVASIRVVITGSVGLAQKELRSLLERETGVSIAGECLKTDIAAVNRLYDPDVLFLCMQPHDAEVSRFRYQRRFRDDRPLVVLAANDVKYARHGFDMDAVDFLLAPFTQERVHRAIERVQRELLRVRLSSLFPSVTSDAYVTGQRGQPERLAVKSEGRIVFVDVDEIDWIAAAANYVRINAGRESYLMREGIGRLAERLDGRRFIRIHRSIIVSARKIRELHHCGYGDYIVVLRSGKELSCSHGFRDGLDRFVSECT